MSDGLKYWQIVDAVYQRGPVEKAARAVLARLARHADSNGVTFLGQPRIVEQTGFSESTVKRAIATLEAQSWIRVEERAVRVETARGWERKGNQYHLNLMKLGLVAEVRRGAVEGGCPGSAERTVEDGCPGPQHDDVEGGCPVVTHEEAEEIASARCHFDAGEVSLEARRGVKMGSPLKKKNKQENPEGLEPPYAPPCRGANVDDSEKQPQRLPDQGGGSARIVPFQRQRAPREARDVIARRAALDGAEAALWDETTRVMKACGVSPEDSGRKLRRTILEAMRLECENSGSTISNVGNMAVKRWREYQEAGSILYEKFGLTRFFAEAEWLHPQLWRFDRRKLEELRRDAAASVGTQQQFERVQKYHAAERVYWSYKAV